MRLNFSKIDFFFSLIIIFLNHEPLKVGSLGARPTKSYPTSLCVV